MSDESEADESVLKATAALGEPEEVYRASPGRQRAKFGMAMGLLLFSVIGLTLWFTVGPARANHFLHMLIMPGVVAIGLLVHMVRHRGVRVLFYPSGLLKLQRGTAESFPWDEITELKLKLDLQGGIQTERDGNAIVNAWFETSTPWFQVWNVWIQLTRQDGETTQITAALADFPDLALRVQKTLFPILDARITEALERGETVSFGDKLTANRHELAYNSNAIPWAEMREFGLVGKMLMAKRTSRWRGAIAVDMASISNFTVLFALAIRKGVPITGDAKK
jgi:hypothetical protein